MHRIISNSVGSTFLRKRRLSALPSTFLRSPDTLQNPTITSWLSRSRINANGRIRYPIFSSQAEERSISVSADDPVDRTSFRNQLDNFYHSTHDVSLREAFHTEHIASGMKTPSILWTCTFECPISGDKTYAGELPGDEFQIEKEGRWYYSSKKTSMQAAARQVLIQSREKPLPATTRDNLVTWYKRNHNINVTDAEFQARKKSMQGKTNGGIWWTASFQCPVNRQVFKAIELQSSEVFRHDSEGYWYRKKSDAINAAAAHAIYINELEGENLKENEASVLGDAPIEDKVPVPSESGPPPPTRAPLIAYYHNEHGVPISNDNFVASLVSFKGKAIGGNWWTATFICPLTSDRYDSKRLVNCKWHEDSDGVLWYKKKEESLLAAGLGAIDTIRFQKTGVTEPRYCQEDPSETGVFQDDPLLLPDLVHKAPGPFETNDTPDVPSLQNDFGENQEEEEYSIEMVPQRLGSFEQLGHESTVSTFDLIAETWLESSHPPDALHTGSQLPQNRYLEIEEAIERAKSWVALQQHDSSDDEGNRICFNSQGQAANMKIANLILDSLARASKGHPLNDEHSGVEAAANAVLEYMWSSPLTTPDAYSYAAFLKCLEGDSSTDSSKKAQRIYAAMLAGTQFEGRILPRPNIAVFNSLVQRLAEAGVETSFQDVDPRMEPNKETFLSILSSMSSRPSNHKSAAGVFDADKALSCIDELQLLSEKYGRPTLLPDVQAYNAPLPWTGCRSKVSSRPFAPWDSYDKLFQKGFKVLLDDHPLIQDASKIEDWYKSMKSGKFGSDIHPDIETAESLIQAWIRTATRDGLENAETLAHSLLEAKSSGLQVRLQTFHPILAAWVYSGAVDGPEKVDYWLKLLNDAGLPVLGDGRYRAAPIVARLARQTQLRHEHDVHELASQSSIGFHTLGVEAGKRLEEMIQDFERGDAFFLEADTFKLALQAWYNVGQACSRMGDLNGAMEALSSIQHIILVFDNIIQSLSISGSEGPQMQLLHLLEASPEVYSAGFTALKEFDQNQAARVSENWDGSHLLNHLSSLERSIRRSEEFRLCAMEIHAKAGVSVTEQALNRTACGGSYIDRFSFATETLVEDTLSVTWLGFYIDIIQALEARKVSPGKEQDFARIAVLISDVLKMQSIESGALVNEHIMNILRKFSFNSGSSETLFSAVQAVYGPRQKRNTRTTSSYDNKSSKRPSSLQAKGQSNSSAKRGLRRRRNVQGGNSQQRNGSPQRDVSQKKQQAC